MVDLFGMGILHSDIDDAGMVVIQSNNFTGTPGVKSNSEICKLFNG